MSISLHSNNSVRTTNDRCTVFHRLNTNITQKNNLLIAKPTVPIITDTDPTKAFVTMYTLLVNISAYIFRKTMYDFKWYLHKTSSNAFHTYENELITDRMELLNLIPFDRYSYFVEYFVGNIHRCTIVSLRLPAHQ